MNNRNPAADGTNLSILIAVMAFAMVYVFGGQTRTATLYGLGAASFVFGASLIMHMRGWKHAHRLHIEVCEQQSQQMAEYLKANKEFAASITKAEDNIVKTLHQAGEDFGELEELFPGEHQRFLEHVNDAAAMALARTGMRSALIMRTQEVQQAS
jgi:hypothetical protein